MTANCLLLVLESIRVIDLANTNYNRERAPEGIEQSKKKQPVPLTLLFNTINSAHFSRDGGRG
jgi:hypothetical protein